MEMAARALAFYSYQKQNEIAYLSFLNRKAQQRMQQLEKGFDSRLLEANRAIGILNTQIKNLKEELESGKQDYKDLEEKFTEKTKQKRKLEELFDALKQKYEAFTRSRHAHNYSPTTQFPSPSRSLTPLGITPSSSPFIPSQRAPTQRSRSASASIRTPPPASSSAELAPPSPMSGLPAQPLASPSALPLGGITSAPVGRRLTTPTTTPTIPTRTPSSSSSSTSSSSRAYQQFSPLLAYDNRMLLSIYYGIFLSLLVPPSSPFVLNMNSSKGLTERLKKIKDAQHPLRRPETPSFSSILHPKSVDPP